MESVLRCLSLLFNLAVRNNRKKDTLSGVHDQRVQIDSEINRRRSLANISVTQLEGQSHDEPASNEAYIADVVQGSTTQLKKSRSIPKQPYTIHEQEPNPTVL